MTRHLRILPVGAIPEWQDRANCQGTDVETFYPEAGGSPRQAKRVCARCEVQAECLQYALERPERHGVWGGLSEAERRTKGKAAAA